MSKSVQVFMSSNIQTLIRWTDHSGMCHNSESQPRHSISCYSVRCLMQNIMQLSMSINLASRKVVPLLPFIALSFPRTRCESLKYLVSVQPTNVLIVSLHNYFMADLTHMLTLLPCCLAYGTPSMC